MKRRPVAVPRFIRDNLGLIPVGDGFTGGSGGKESAYNAGDPGSIPGLRRFPWRREQQPIPVILPGEFHGQRSLIQTPWDYEESEMTE